MARLTEQEMELIRRAKFAARIHSIDYHDVLAEAQRMKSETLARLLGQATRWVARTTGLAALGRLLSRSVIMPLRRRILRRRTVAGLQQLDDRLLSDIGLKREDIGYLATQLSEVSVPSPSPAAERDVPGAMGGRIRRWRTRRELEALSDHVLNDIGVLRSEIPALVDRLQGRSGGRPEAAAIKAMASAGAHLPAGPGNAQAKLLADLGLASLPPTVVGRLMKHAA
jgi:uncharacterized protein YjiS (DUF1127 family)